jgi:hypothetical protein
MPRSSAAPKREMEKRPGFLLSLGMSGMCLVALAGCTAAVGGGDHRPGPVDLGSAGSSPLGSGGMPSVPGGGAPSVPGGGAAACDANASLAPARIWRLTDEEYVNVVQAVFGVTMPAEISEAQVNTGDYTNLSEGTNVSDPIALNYQKAAHEAAQQAVTSHLSTFLSCGVTAPTDACVQEFIKNRVARAFGRPLTDQEVSGLLAVYKMSDVDGPPVGIRLVIEAALQSGSFLYRTELGAPKDGGPTAKATLTPFEVASALSFSLLDSIPDDALWTAAQNGSLMTPSVLASQVDRLLALPAAQANLSHQAGYWLAVEKIVNTQKDSALFPEYTDDLKSQLYTSAQMFVQDLFAHGTVKDLLTSRRMYLNESLAKLYGIPGVTGTAFMPVDVQLPERAGGILTQPAVMAATDQRPNRSDPIHRGLFIYRSLVCGASIGAPPKDATSVDASLPANATERQRSDFRTSITSPGCSVCHGMFDPFGLSTERYDPIGRYVPTVDSTATISARVGDALAGPVTGLPDVIARLEQGRTVADCAVANLAQMTLGRQVKDDTSCAIQNIKDKFAASGSFADFYRALLTSPGFITRDAQ